MGVRRLTLARQYLVLQFLIVLAVLVTVGAISLAQTAQSIEHTEGRRALAAAENLAKQKIVRELVQVAEPGGDSSLAAAGETNRQVSGSELVAIARTDQTVLVSSYPDLVGKVLPTGDHGAADGRSWSGLSTIGGVSYVTAIVPVQSVDVENAGEVIGLAVIGREFPSAWDRLETAMPNLLTYLGVASLLGLIGSLALSRLVKRQTLGMEPTEIAALVEHREALVHGVKEGVVALDAQQRVTVANDSARRMLELDDECTGTHVAELGLDPHVLDVFTHAQLGPDRLALVGDRVLAFNRMPMRLRGRVIGTVTTMRDRTELSSLEKELDNTLATTDTLRAQTHEFANQLHVISGLLHLEQHEEAQRFVHGVRLTRTRVFDDVTSRIHDPSVAALLIAKSSLAAERGVNLELDPASEMGEVSEGLSRDLTTVVGNLVDNALEASAAPNGAGAPRVRVLMHDDDGQIVVTVQDSGPGVPAEQAPEVFRQGYTTKAPAAGGRGFGLALTQLVCRRRGGDVTVHNDAGAVFTAVLEKENPSA